MAWLHAARNSTLHVYVITKIYRTKEIMISSFMAGLEASKGELSAECTGWIFWTSSTRGNTVVGWAYFHPHRMAKSSIYLVLIAEFIDIHLRLCSIAFLVFALTVERYDQAQTQLHPRTTSNIPNASWHTWHTVLGVLGDFLFPNSVRSRCRSSKSCIPWVGTGERRAYRYFRCIG